MAVAHGSAWLVIVGDGPQRERLQQSAMTRAPKLGAIRRRAHRRPRATKRYGRFVEWQHYEGQSNTILEAMAQGVPVIASDIPGNRDLVAHEQTGYLYPLGDVAVLSRLTVRLLNDERSARQWAKPHSPALATNSRSPAWSSGITRLTSNSSRPQTSGVKFTGPAFAATLRTLVTQDARRQRLPNP